MLTVTMPSSVLSAAVKSVQETFPGHGSMLYIMITSIYVLGMTAGPFIWAPVSEVFGRRFTVLLTFIPFSLFNAGVCGSPNLTTLLVLRFCAGMFGCSSMTNSGYVLVRISGTHADCLVESFRTCSRHMIVVWQWVFLQPCRSWVLQWDLS